MIGVALLLSRAYLTTKEGLELLGESEQIHETAEAMDLVRASETPRFHMLME